MSETSTPVEGESSEQLSARERLERHQGPFETEWLLGYIKKELKDVHKRAEGYKDPENTLTNCERIENIINKVDEEILPKEITLPEFIATVNKSYGADLVNVGGSFAHRQGPNSSKEYEVSHIVISSDPDYHNDALDFLFSSEGLTSRQLSGANAYDVPVKTRLLPFVYIINEV